MAYDFCCLLKWTNGCSFQTWTKNTLSLHIQKCYGDWFNIFSNICSVWMKLLISGKCIAFACGYIIKVKVEFYVHFCHNDEWWVKVYTYPIYKKYGKSIPKHISLWPKCTCKMFSHFSTSSVTLKQINKWMLPYLSQTTISNLYLYVNVVK